MFSYGFHIYIRGTLNNYPDFLFFVLAFKTVVDSWKFSILLLDMLRDDRPISSISDSKGQLEQELECTLLNPDYHSWWISKMQSGREDTLEEQYAIKFSFKLGKKATETYGMLQTAFGACCMNWAWVFEWHKRFKEGSLWRMMRVVGGVRESMPQSWLAKRLGLVSSGRDSVGSGQYSSNRVSVLYSHLLIHAEIYIYRLDTYRCNNN